MKTRLIYTKIWEDKFFAGLSNTAKYLFLYLITNYRINLCGIYELQERYLIFETSLKNSQLSIAKKELEPKIFFCEDWVYVVNAKRLGGYKGQKNDVACKKELSEIPNDVENTFNKLLQDRVLKKDDSVCSISDTSINHKSEIKNKKSIPFEKFWNLYDKKVERFKTEKIWNKLTETLQQEIIDKVPDYVQVHPDKKYRKHPTTFLNNKCWEDEIITNKPIIIRK